ncbi:TetR/AcrR family transcriptional regulator [Streptomyces sp. NPDC052101]|uniref:TetR/AcrR family transcriptional regulator n=1 Tax=Streptomyces sp. NPDC052101 TaxID=3155763 RepID=UPI0034350FE7
MGHREDLLVGAKRCLIEKGYARTTTRDIVAASGTNLASIGYHYGSKEALLNKALIDAVSDSASQLADAMTAGSDAAPMDQFEAMWTRLIEQFATNKQLWLASFEVFAQIGRVPSVRDALADGIQQGREGMAQMFRGTAGENTDEQALLAVGSFYQALATGIMAQWLVDPERAPSGSDLALAMRTIMDWQRTAEPEAQSAT